MRCKVTTFFGNTQELISFFYVLLNTYFPPSPFHFSPFNFQIGLHISFLFCIFAPVFQFLITIL